MPELLEQRFLSEHTGVPPVGARPNSDGVRVREDADRRARGDLRRQIARLERELGELFASAFPRPGFEWGVAAAGGPRVLGVSELERVRDGLVVRLREARAELARRADVEERHRELLELMISNPAEYRWVRVSNQDIGEPGCRHWHSRPRWGLLGMIAGWWRIRLSSGCPLAGGRGPAASRPIKRHGGPQDAKAPTARGGRTRAGVRPGGRQAVPGSAASAADPWARRAAALALGLISAR
jgi:hypothetical protein